MAVSVYECAVLAELVYRCGYEKDRQDPIDGHVGFPSDTTAALTDLGGWQRQYWTADAHTGFVGAIFQKDNDVVVSYRGSVSVRKDWLGSDKKLAFGVAPENKIEKAVLLRYKALEMYHKPVMLVGHSLGGALAQAAASVTGSAAVTFNAPGVQKIVKKAGYAVMGNLPPIVNFRAAQDPVSDLMGPHLGLVYDVDTFPQTQKLDTGTKLKEKGESHRMTLMVKYIDKQPWRDASPFDNRHGYWTDGKGAVALP
jgi:Protein of unknown function (DUF2974)